jgi:hypothetical protein
MSSKDPEYSAWLWQYDGPMSMFDGTYEECVAHVAGVYKRFDAYYAEEVAKYRGKRVHPDMIPKRPNMEIHSYMSRDEMREMYR